MKTITSRTDIETYVANAHPDFTGSDAARLVAAIQDAAHPAYGRDWSEWLQANIERLRDVAVQS